MGAKPAASSGQTGWLLISPPLKWEKRAGPAGCASLSLLPCAILRGWIASLGRLHAEQGLGRSLVQAGPVPPDGLGQQSPGPQTGGGHWVWEETRWCRVAAGRRSAIPESQGEQEEQEQLGCCGIWRNRQPCPEGCVAKQASPEPPPPEIELQLCPPSPKTNSEQAGKACFENLLASCRQTGSLGILEAPLPTPHCFHPLP